MTRWSWSWYWKVKKQHVAKQLCSTLPTIDSFKLHKNEQAFGFTVKPLDVNAMQAQDKLIITYRKQTQSSYSISIDKMPCNYGGFLYYFRCPLCSRRMRFLYFAAQSLFLCRKCLNLSYFSQRLRPTLRHDYMSNKIKEFIKSKGGDIDDRKRPRGMHNKRYDALRSKRSIYDDKAHQALKQELRQWYGAKVEFYLDHTCDHRDKHENLTSSQL